MWHLFSCYPSKEASEFLFTGILWHEDQRWRLDGASASEKWLGGLSPRMERLQTGEFCRFAKPCTCVLCVRISSGDQRCRRRQEVPINDWQYWLGTERRGIPASQWSRLTCACCVWPPVCSLQPPVLLHLLSLPSALNTHRHGPVHTRTGSHLLFLSTLYLFSGLYS